MEFNSPYGPVEGNLENLEIKVIEGGSGYENKKPLRITDLPIGKPGQILTDVGYTYTPVLVSRGIDVELFSPEEMEKHEDIIQMIMQEINKNEETLIKQVLKQLLKRDATLEDFKKVNRVFFGPQTEKYTLAYEGVELGTVEYQNCPTNHFTVRFYPNEPFK